MLHLGVCVWRSVLFKSQYTLHLTDLDMHAESYSATLFLPTLIIKPTMQLTPTVLLYQAVKSLAMQSYLNSSPAVRWSQVLQCHND